ncbi:hypothetical protein [Pseudoxanthomonas mexicana]|uniref:hypothetical protein n=1 Tax=Pseudoxanthomonas mexicana TaxID=128785 RepID=UPI00398A5428
MPSKGKRPTTGFWLLPLLLAACGGLKSHGDDQYSLGRTDRSANASTIRLWIDLEAEARNHCKGMGRQFRLLQKVGADRPKPVRARVYFFCDKPAPAQAAR